MNSEKIFGFLNKRLFELTNQSEYVVNFDYEKVIESIKSGIFSLESQLAVNELNRCLIIIDSINKNKNDIFKNFVSKRSYEEISFDEYGNRNVESVKEYISLPENLKAEVIAEIALELRYYKGNLEPLRNNLASIDGQVSAKDNPQAIKTKKTEYSGFTFLGLETNKEGLKDLFDILKKNKLISEKTKSNDFKKAFTGRIPNQKVHWTGGVQALKYFIDRLFDENHLDKSDEARIWIITKLLFTLDEKGSIISSNLRGLKVPKTKTPKIDKILKTLY
jgi:hypothetical protein